MPIGIWGLMSLMIIAAMIIVGYALIEEWLEERQKRKEKKHDKKRGK